MSTYIAFILNIFDVVSDVIECEDGTDRCDVNAFCENTVGSHECTCIDGFRGSGYEGDCAGKLPQIRTCNVLYEC